MRKETIEELNTIGARTFIQILINHRRKSVTNPNSVLNQRLDDLSDFVSKTVPDIIPPGPQVAMYVKGRMKPRDKYEAKMTMGKYVNILEKPYTPEQILGMKEDSDGFIVEGVVEVDLSDLIDNDLEGFLDVLEERFIEHGVLSNIDYDIVGTTGNNMLLINVSGYTTADSIGADKWHCKACNHVYTAAVESNGNIPACHKCGSADVWGEHEQEDEE